MGDTFLTVTATVLGNHVYSEQISALVSVYPGFYANQKEIVLSNHYTTADIKIFGSTEVLNNLEVSFPMRMLLLYIIKWQSVQVVGLSMPYNSTDPF